MGNLKFLFQKVFSLTLAFFVWSCSSSSEVSDLEVTDAPSIDEDLSLLDPTLGGTESSASDPSKTSGAATSSSSSDELSSLEELLSSSSTSSEKVQSPAASSPALGATSGESSPGQSSTPLSQPTSGGGASPVSIGSSLRASDILPFRSSEPTVGLTITGIDWQAELSQDNPGVDCDLKKRQGSSRKNVYSCVESHSRGSLIVTAREKVQRGVRRLDRIVVDYFSSNQLGFFTRQLEEAGFRLRPGQKGKKIPKWISRDGATTAWMRYDSKKKISSLVLEPAR